ncbi:MAG: T9SS type A sorting domain-containing protein [Bacteroidota bacterium]|nr:T9SS type A sorting domain-containing protein [Bacteroidota bacterium]
MKLILISILLPFLFLCHAFAQFTAPCGTITTDYTRIKNLSVDREERTGINSRATTYYVPIKFRVLQNDDGSNYYYANHVFDLLCELNEQFLPLSIKFYIHGEIDFIANSIYNIHDINGGMDMMNEYNEYGVVNTYIVSDPSGYCGYAWYPGTGPAGGGVVLGKNCSGPGNSTFAHELGHYFSLPHTFDGWDFDPEFVDGSNCASAGDYFCDTPADYLDYRWNCPYSGSFVDSNGDAYDPDGTYFMSYSIEPCGNKFSLEQESAIIYSLNYDYDGQLINHPVPSVFEVQDISVLQQPENNSTEIGQGQVFNWEPVQGASHYQFVLHRKNVSSFLRTDIIIQDTFYTVTGLTGNTDYEWRVKAFHPNSTCAPFSDKFYFKTAVDVGLQDLTAGIEIIELFPNPVKSGEIINFKINAPVITVELMDLYGKKLKYSFYEEVNTQNQLQLPELKSGIYLLKFSTKDQSVYKKLVVQ